MVDLTIGGIYDIMQPIYVRKSKGKEGMVKVFMTDTSAQENLPLQLAEMLPAYRREKIHCCKNPKAARESLVAGLLLCHVLHMYGIDPDEIRICGNGKPEIDGIYFNLSHSGGRAVCAIGNAEVGCDIEKVRKAPMKIASRYFCTVESEYLRAAEESEFFRLWTVKESYIKMTGEGLRLPLDSFSVVQGGRVGISETDDSHPVYLREFEAEGYKIAICAREAIENKMHLVDTASLLSLKQENSI